MTILMLKAIHFFGYLLWFGALYFIVWNIRKIILSNSETESTNQLSVLSENAMSVYKKTANPAMMLTWSAGLLMLYMYGMDWFRINLWIHQKIALLILLTVYHIYCKMLLMKLSLNSGAIKKSQSDIFHFLFFAFPAAIIITAVFRTLSPAVTGSLVVIMLIPVVYLGTILSRKSKA